MTFAARDQMGKRRAPKPKVGTENFEVINLEDSVRLEVSPIQPMTSDVTYYWKRGTEQYEKFRTRIDWQVKSKQFQHPSTINDRFSLDGVSARGCVGYCFGREFISGTFRTENDVKVCWPVTKLSSGTRWTRIEESKIFEDGLTQASSIASFLWQILRQESTSGRPDNLGEFRSPSGLVIIAGSTNSAKSSIAQSVALSSILREVREIEGMGKELAEKQRLPHLVTYEDPIEKWEITEDGRSSSLVGLGIEKILKFGFCFTPRERGKDVPNLGHALTDALRQTPKCFYVGEVRDKKEWESVVEFAGTGHLTIATTHADTLSEAIHRVMTAVGANNAARRREIASRLLSCVHLKKVPEAKRSGNLVLPTIWRRSVKSISALVSEGLSSVVPNNDYVLGRFQFFERLVNSGELSNRDREKLESRIEEAKRSARRLDLEELQRP